MKKYPRKPRVIKNETWRKRRRCGGHGGTNDRARFYLFGHAIEHENDGDVVVVLYTSAALCNSPVHKLIENRILKP